MSLNFVNASGEPIAIGSRQSHQPKKRPPAKPRTEKEHHGFAVVGYSPQQLADGKEKHEKDLEEKPGLGPWNAEAWMSAHKPIKARSKPYAIPAAAEDCADLMRNTMGWLRVQVVEVIR